MYTPPSQSLDVQFGYTFTPSQLPPVELEELLELDELEELELELEELLDDEELELLLILELLDELELLEELELLVPEGSPNTIPRPAVLMYTRPYTFISPTTNAPLAGPPNSCASSFTRTQVAASSSERNSPRTPSTSAQI